MKILGWLAVAALVLFGVWWFFCRGQISGASQHVTPDFAPPQPKGFSPLAALKNAFRNPASAAVDTVAYGAKGLYNLPNKSTLAKQQAVAIVQSPTKLLTAFSEGHLSTGTKTNPLTGQPAWKG